MSSGSLRSEIADVDAGKVAEVNGACHSHCPEASPSLSSSTLFSSPSFQSVIFCDTLNHLKIGHDILIVLKRHRHYHRCLLSLSFYFISIML